MLPHWLKSGMPIEFGPLFGSELRVLLNPQTIELSLLKTDFLHGFKPKIVKHQVIQAGNIADETGLSDKLLSKLAAALRDPAWHQAAPVLVFSNAFVHYAVLPWNEDIKTKVERAAYLQHGFLQHFGEASKSWLLCEHITGYGKASIGSGINAALLGCVEAVFEAADMPLKAAHPLLMRAMNQAVFYLKQNKLAQNFWLVCVEGQRLTLTLVVEGDWKLVRNVVLEAECETQLHTLMQREAVLAELADTLPLLAYSNDEIHSIAVLTQPQAIPLHEAIYVIPRAA